MKSSNTISCGCHKLEKRLSNQHENYVGKKFGKLTVVECVEIKKGRKPKFLCKCDCGNEVVVSPETLRRSKEPACRDCTSKRVNETISEHNIINLVGQRFGKLTVIERAENKDKRVRWRCKCDCGNETIVNGNSLKGGITQSCGCLRDESRHSRVIDLTGQVFGKLLVLERAKNKGRNICWKCRCECGNEVVVAGNNLRRGSVTTCGCLKHEDLTGLKFGYLTVIERAEPDNHGRARWLCRCECGKEIVVRQWALKSGGTKSCGCLVSSRSTDYYSKIKIGQKYSYLTVIGRADERGNGISRWLCRCDCGKEVVMSASSLLKENQVHSCGCKRIQFPRLNEIVDASKRPSGHGFAKKCAADLRCTWGGIKERCFNPNAHGYRNYGGRGITMYPAWVHDLQAFFDYVSTLEHFGEEGYTLDRIDNNGNYEPNNLRWADRKTQSRNRRNTRIVEYNGESMSLAEAAERSGISRAVLFNRVKYGDTGGRLFRPVKSSSVRKSSLK